MEKEKLLVSYPVEEAEFRPVISIGGREYVVMPYEKIVLLPQEVVDAGALHPEYDSKAFNMNIHAESLLADIVEYLKDAVAVTAVDEGKHEDHHEYRLLLPVLMPIDTHERWRREWTPEREEEFRNKFIERHKTGKPYIFKMVGGKGRMTMKQTPIFIPLSSIESIGEAETTPYRCGLMEIVPKGKQLQGFRCDCLTAKYYWQSNGAGKGFAQMLYFTFEGRRSHLNFLTRTMHNSTNRFIVLLPMGDSWLVFGSQQEPPEIIGQEPTCGQDFMMECEYSTIPYPYFDGEVIVDDCDVVELMEHLFNVKLEDKEK